MEQRKYFRFAEGVDRPGATESVKLPDGADVVDFLDAMFATKHLSDSILRGLRPSALKVYENEKAGVPLRRSDKLGTFGESKDDPIIVQLPRVWYELRDADSGASFANTGAASVRLTESDSVETLLNAVYGANGGTLAHTAPTQLAAYESQTCFAKNQPLGMASAIGSCGRLKNAPVVVMVPKRGKRHAEGGDTEEAAKRQKVGVNKDSLAFVEPYQSTAARLKNMDEVTKVVEAVATVQQCPEVQIPFIVLESSSGTGKTQMAFNLMARDDIDVFYIVCGVVGVNVQYVYTAFRTRSIVFGQCVSKDTEGKRMKSGDVSEIEAAGELQTYALICALLAGSETMAETATREEVEEALIAWKKRAPGKQCAIFLDEFPREEPSRIIHLRFMRNVFRSFRLPVILSSTNGAARNLINYGQHSRGADDKTLWCVVLTKFPRFQDPFLDRLRPDLRLIIEHSRPLFARMAVDFVKKAGPNESAAFDETADLVGLMDRMAAVLGNIIASVKSLTLAFRCGQLRLFLAGNYVYDDCNELIDKHYARLQEDDQFQLSIPPGGKATLRRRPKANYDMPSTRRDGPSRDGRNKRDFVKNDEDYAWICQTNFPDLKDDPLLYFWLMGGKDVGEHQALRALQDEEGYPISFNCALNLLEQGHVKFNFGNTFQTGNNGQRLEALTAGAIVSASHRNGFAGIGFMDFFRSLLYEFDMQQDIDLPVKFSDEVATLLSTLTVPYLAPPNQTLPDFLKEAKLNLGEINRSVNQDMYNASLLDGRVSVECKDYRSRPISSDDMKGILIRVRDLAQREPTIVRLVVTTKLQGSYFKTKKNTFMKALASGVNGIPKELHHAHFYRIGIHDGETTTDDQGNVWRNDLESIRGMENKCRSKDCPESCTRVEMVIIFVERWKTDDELPPEVQS